MSYGDLAAAETLWWRLTFPCKPPNTHRSAALQGRAAINCVRADVGRCPAWAERPSACKQLLHWVTPTPTAAGSTYCSPLPEKASRSAQRHLSRVSPERPRAPLSHNSSQSVTRIREPSREWRTEPRDADRRVFLSSKMEGKIILYASVVWGYTINLNLTEIAI